MLNSLPQKLKVDKKIVKKKVVESVLSGNCPAVIKINRSTPLTELMCLLEGQTIEDETGRVGTLLSIEIKKYRIETHIYLKHSSDPKMILIIK